MRSIGSICAIVLASALAFAQSPHLSHNSCSWCHINATFGATSVSKPLAASAPARPSARVCLSCHDGMAAQFPEDGHLNHAPTHSRPGMDCVACHDPHDRTGSYCMLRGKNGPETERTAVLGFCRGCHTEH